ncbi:hypothetical protein BGX27_010162 [Mortierella sp. AM989]|nr:hypothetical protein BGX27_010162 [Mortierella sp. AM989]
MQVPSSILEKHSGFADLITDINTRFLAPTGLSLKYDKKLHQARYGLKNKKSYLETKTLYEAIDRLRFLPLDKQRKETSLPLAPRYENLQQQIAIHVDRIISILEARRLTAEVSDNSVNREFIQHNGGEASVPIDKHGAGTGTTKIKATASVLKVLAGMSISSADLNNGLGHDSRELEPDLDNFTFAQLQPHLNTLEGFAQPMIEAIQQTIQQRVQDVVAISNNSNSGAVQPCTELTPLLKSLSDVIINVRKQLLFLDRVKEETVLNESVIQSKAEALFDTLHQSIVILWEIVVEFMIQYQLEEDQTFKEYFEQMVESVVLKLEYALIFSSGCFGHVL